VLLGLFLRQTAFGLDYAHEQGVIHNDFSRENVLARAGEVATLIDFGSATIDGKGNLDVGKPKLMSPERIEGNISRVDGRSDQFALAVTAFLWITGQYPFPGEGQIVLNRMREDPLALSEAGCPQAAALQPVFDRAFQKNPVDRFSTCSEFANALSNPNS
jgi:serine/threonine protein kinase, bacterial